MVYDLTAQFTQTVLTEAFSAESRRMSMMPQKEGVIIHLAGDLKPLPIFDMPSAPISISIDGKWANESTEDFYACQVAMPCVSGARSGCHQLASLF